MLQESIIAVANCRDTTDMLAKLCSKKYSLTLHIFNHFFIEHAVHLCKQPLLINIGWTGAEK